MFRPMLACSESAHNFFDKLRFPLYASPKLDGIRATVRDGVVVANEARRGSLYHRKALDLIGGLAVRHPGRRDMS